VPDSGRNVASPIVKGGGVVNEDPSIEVTPLITTKDADGASESVVPKAVIAGPPGMSVWPATTNVGPEGSGSALKTSFPIVMVGGALSCVAGLASKSVAPLATTKEAEGPSDRVVPETVIADPPGTRVWPPMTNVFGELGRGEKMLLPTVSVGGVATGTAPPLNVEDTPLTTSIPAEGASDNVVPAMVIAEPPGVSVWPEITNVGPATGLF